MLAIHGQPKQTMVGPDSRRAVWLMEVSKLDR